MARILVVGNGAREHALALGLARSASGPHALFVAPGNAGTSAIARNIAVAATDVTGLVELARRERIDLVVVGPELPLTLGLVDALQAAGIAAFGPSRAAARLEGSKAYMKAVCARAGVPTAGFEVFDDAAAARRYVREAARALVVKADGLCAGKGVVVAKDTAEALEAVDSMLVARAFGDAGARIVVEELLSGDEASFHVVCDGERCVPLVPAQDHKRVFDDDRGPNTGGMGAYAPAPIVDEAVQSEVMRAIVAPTLRAMADDGTPFRGVLFVGLMIENGVPRVLEFNVRFGDPETSVLVPSLEGDWFSLLDGAARGTLDPAAFATRPGAALAVVLAAENYPATPRTGDVITGIADAVETVDDAFVLHAGTRRVDDAVVSAGGRVLVVGAHAATFDRARAAAYRATSLIAFRGMHFRKDIGARAMRV